METLFDNIWREHLVKGGAEGMDLLFCDRHLVHEVTSPQAFAGLRRLGRKVRRPDLTFAVIDHVVPTTPYTRPLADQVAEEQLAALEKNCADFGVELFHPTTPTRG